MARKTEEGLIYRFAPTSPVGGALGGKGEGPSELGEPSSLWTTTTAAASSPKTLRTLA